MENGVQFTRRGVVDNSERHAGILLLVVLILLISLMKIKRCGYKEDLRKGKFKAHPTRMMHICIEADRRTKYYKVQLLGACYSS
jgi:hypothetical protein